GESHRLINQARIEIDVRIELARHEVLVLQRNPLELERDLEERILAGYGEDDVGDPLHDLGAWIVRLVDAMTEPHQAVAGFARLHLLDEPRHLADPPDF